MRILRFKKITLPLGLSGALILSGWLLFTFNFLGLQDYYYGSKYFRPYAELKQELNRNQIVALRNNNILLLGYESSELFDPYKKDSQMLGGWKDSNTFAEYINALELANGNILFWQGSPTHPNSITCRNKELKNFFCPLDQILQFERKTGKFIFRPFPFPLQFLQGHTANLLPNGEVLITGGRLYSLDLASRHLLKLLNGQSYQANNVIIYNPTTNTYKVLGHLINPRYDHHIFFTKDNKFIVIGGKENEADNRTDPHPTTDRFINTIERFDLKTGQSKIIKTIKHGENGEIVSLGNNKYILCWNYIKYGVTSSELIDLIHPKKDISIYGKPPKNHIESNGKCVLLSNKRILCIGEKEVREIDPINFKSRSLDSLITPQLSSVQVVNIPKIGILVFGNSRNLFGTVKTVQKFDYERYLKDYK